MTGEPGASGASGGTAGTERQVRLPMPDGVELAATLYLPDPALGPQPCLLEALPYRKDDLTSNAAEEYRLLRDGHAYAVCRVDLRGTGSSAGDAVDEYPPSELDDVAAVIAWLAEQEWCTGAVGMWGTSYSGFNSLQVACERPAALRAVCAIYATDDRWTDDVHWRGGALRLVDLVDYCHYMTAMNVLPPVPSLWNASAPEASWRVEWHRRLDEHEPWVLTWLREHRDSPYWRHGSVRRPDSAAATGSAGSTGYERIACPVMIVAGWADGYRNSSFRTAAALREAGVPTRLLAGPWAHADPATAIPGPRIDLVPEMVAWWDEHLRGVAPEGGAAPPPAGGPPDVQLFVRTSTRPDPALEVHAGTWVADTWPSDRSAEAAVTLAGPRTVPTRPDVGTAAWIDCAGHLPWGLSDDQRLDDALSATWDLTPSEVDALLGRRAVVGQPCVRLRLRADAPAASLSVKLCDVFPDGTSALVTRGTLDLAYRDGVHGTPSALVPGETYDVELELDACAYAFDAGQVLRVSVAGADWPNTVAPPAPVTLVVEDGELWLPTYDLDTAGVPPPSFTPGAARSSESADDVGWTIERDVLARTTTARTASSTEYEIPGEGWAEEHYAGSVSVDLGTHDQRAEAVCTFALTWPGVDVRVTSTMAVEVTAGGYEVGITTEAWDEGVPVSRRDWHRTLPR